MLHPSAPPRGVIHFVGGAFAGAAPQLTYRLLLETLCDRGELAIIATPYSLSFDHLRITDDAQFGFDRARRALGPRLPPDLPVWGVGHSLGALIQTLISARYAAQRAGTVLMSAWRSGALSFLPHAYCAGVNNKPASDAIPLILPLLSPAMQSMSPLLAGLAASPLRSPAEQLREQLRQAAPAAVREALPLLDQLEPLTLDLVAGRTEFSPSPAETQRLISSFYKVPRTLLLRFSDDSIDETPQFAATLLQTQNAAGGGAAEVSVSTLPGDHVRPLQRPLPPPPPEVLGAALQGEAALGALSSFAASIGAPTFPLSALRDGVRAGVQTLQTASAAATPTTGGGDAASSSAERDVGLLAEAILSFIERR